MCDGITSATPHSAGENVTLGGSDPNSQPGTQGAMLWCAHRDCRALLRQVQGNGPAETGPPALPWKTATKWRT